MGVIFTFIVGLLAAFEPITDNDLVFYHNGRLAKFLKEVNNPWS